MSFREMKGPGGKGIPRRERFSDLPRGLLALLLLTVSLTAGNGSVRVGADRIFESPYWDWIRGKRIGLITNQTGVDSALVHILDRLDSREGVQVTVVFTPEHGFLGAAQAGEKLGSSGRIQSLYGARRAPSQESLQAVDVLIYDIQDVEARFYTYISTLAECLKAASRRGIPLIVLDRPPPLGGHLAQGPVLEEAFVSFVGVHPLPIRYAMTPGELAGLFKDEMEIAVDLKVVPLEGWRRGLWFEQTGLSWVAPSPNMPTTATALVYPGFCLIEGTNLSEARGTTRPFEMFGAPWLDARTLSRRLNALKLAGAVFRPQAFKPTFSKYRGENCQGVQVHVVDRDSFQPVRTALHVVQETRLLHPDRFRIDEARFNGLIGNSWVRQALLEGTPVNTIVSRWQGTLEEFRKRRSKYLKYE